MTLALIAGAGALPAAVVAALPQRPFICALGDFPGADLPLRLERLIPTLRALQDRGVHFRLVTSFF